MHRRIIFFFIICILDYNVLAFSSKYHHSRKFKLDSHRRYLERVRKIYPPPPKGFGGTLDNKNEHQSQNDPITNITKESEKAWLKRYPYLTMRDIWSKFNYSGDIRKGAMSGRLMVSKRIKRPNYYKTGTPTPIPYDDSNGLIKTQSDIEGIKKACLVARKILDSVHPYIRTGIMTDTIDRHIHRMCDLYNVYPSPLRYKGFPKSVCISINEIVCHGIPDSNVLATGDFVNVDVTVYMDGYHGDVSETFLVLPDVAFSQNEFGKREPVTIGGYEQRKMERLAIQREYVSPGRISETSLRNLEDKIGRKTSENTDYYGIKRSTLDSNLKLSNDYMRKLKGYESRIQYKSPLDDVPEFILPYSNKLLKSAYNATMAGIAACGPGKPLKVIGEAINAVLDRDGFTTKPYLLGHGTGRNFHENPDIKFVLNDDNTIMQPGMVFTIEPVIFENNCQIITWPDGWTISTDDGSRTAQYEHTIAITHTGVDILTSRLDTSPILYFLDDNMLFNRIERIKRHFN